MQSQKQIERRDETKNMRNFTINQIGQDQKKEEFTQSISI